MELCHKNACFLTYLAALSAIMDHVSGLEINFLYFFMAILLYLCEKWFVPFLDETSGKKLAEIFKIKQKNCIFTAFSAIIENFRSSDL